MAKFDFLFFFFWSSSFFFFFHVIKYYAVNILTQFIKLAFKGKNTILSSLNSTSFNKERLLTCDYK